MKKAAPIALSVFISESLTLLLTLISWIAGGRHQKTFQALVILLFWPLWVFPYDRELLKTYMILVLIFDIAFYAILIWGLIKYFEARRELRRLR